MVCVCGGTHKSAPRPIEQEALHPITFGGSCPWDGGVGVAENWTLTLGCPARPRDLLLLGGSGSANAEALSAGT